MPVTIELVSYIAAAVGALALVWFRIEALVKISRRELAEDTARLQAELRKETANLQTDLRDLSDTFKTYQLHVSETYASKQGLKEQMLPLFEAVKDVGGQVRHISERLDRVIDSRPAAARRASAS